MVNQWLLMVNSDYWLMWKNNEWLMMLSQWLIMVTVIDGFTRVHHGLNMFRFT